MARYVGPRMRLCRREGINLFGNPKFNIEKRDTPPGQHGGKRKAKLSDYGVQLREKQKVKRVYGVLEKQFRKYYLSAARQKGVTGETLLQSLERRLDNVVYRLGFATTRPQARQIVSHQHVYVNDRRVNIASYLIKVGDEVSLKLTDKSQKFIDANIDSNKDQNVPDWLTVDHKHYKGKVARLPERSDIQFPINEQLIVELYSK